MALCKLRPIISTLDVERKLMDIVWDGIKRTETLNESAADACSALADADADADAAKAYDCLHFQPFNFFSGDRRVLR